MRSPEKGVMSAATQVKVLSPEITPYCTGLRVSFSVSQNRYERIGEFITGVPGSESVAGKRTVCIGTWENHIAPNGSFQQAEKARRKYGDMVVGLTHSRGVTGVMPGEFRKDGTLEGVSSKMQRDEVAYAIH